MTGSFGQATEPSIAPRAKPNFRGAGRASIKPVEGVKAVQAPSDIFKRSAETGERVGLEINVPKLDLIGPDRFQEPILLPADPGITDGALGIVPNGQFGQHRVHLHRSAQPCGECLTSLGQVGPASGCTQKLVCE